jgi:hypothetical protein
MVGLRSKLTTTRGTICLSMFNGFASNATAQKIPVREARHKEVANLLQEKSQQYANDIVLHSWDPIKDRSPIRFLVYLSNLGSTFQPFTALLPV